TPTVHGTALRRPGRAAVARPCRGGVHGLPIEIYVLPRGGRPREVGAKRARYQSLPLSPVGIGPYGAVHGAQQLGRVVLREHEPRALTRGAVVLNRIRQPAGCPHYRNRAVTQAHELPEAARLEPGGHEE